MTPSDDPDPIEIIPTDDDREINVALDREKPCARSTWCMLARGHTGPCVESKLTLHAPPDFGPSRSKPR